MKTLKKGCKGDEVKTLQKLLGVAVDGDFGPKTEAAVIAFQKAQSKRLCLFLCKDIPARSY